MSSAARDARTTPPNAPGPELLGCGTARPAHTWDQRQALEFAQRRGTASERDPRALEALFRRSGVVQRGIAAADAFYPLQRAPTTAERMQQYLPLALPLALEASRVALAEARCDAEDVTHLVTVSCTGFTAPGLDLALLAGLGLSPRVQRLHVGFMGCHGLLNALGAARSFARPAAAGAPGSRGPAPRVLVCSAEICSLHFRYGLPAEEAVSHALFADGAAALVFGAGGSGGGAWRLAATGSLLLPESHDAMSWRVGDHGFEMQLSPRVPDLVGRHLRPWLQEWLAEHALRPEQVASWAIHPGGPRVLDDVAGALQLAEAQISVSRQLLSACGNMSSATIGFLLERLRRQAAPLPCVALAFGPGLVIEGALFTAAQAPPG